MLDEGSMGDIQYKPTNCFKRWPVTCEFTRKKRRKATTSLRQSFVNGKDTDQKAQKEQEMMVSSLGTWTKSNGGIFERGTTAGKATER
jgi:hypothetical protein